MIVTEAVAPQFDHVAPGHALSSIVRVGLQNEGPQSALGQVQCRRQPSQHPKPVVQGK